MVTKYNQKRIALWNVTIYPLIIGRNLPKCFKNGKSTSIVGSFEEHSAPLGFPTQTKSSEDKISFGTC